MVETCRTPRLAQKSLDVGGILGEVLAEDLDGDETVEGFFVRLVDDAHSAPSKLGNDPVMAQSIHQQMLLSSDPEGAGFFDLCSSMLARGVRR
jgi:hypothetical protein